jgi:hypothetical protein
MGSLPSSSASIRFRPHIAESMPDPGTRMPQTLICARALATSRQQWLSTSHPQGDGGNGLLENHFNTASPALTLGKFFPDWQNFPWQENAASR